MSTQEDNIQRLIDRNPDYPVVVTSINTNLLPFKTSILRDHVEETIQKAHTMREYIAQQQVFNQKLMINGLVENVEQNLTVQLLDGKSSSPFVQPPLGLSPYYQFTPVKKFTAKTGSKIGNGEGDGYLEFQLRNYFGTGEKFVMDIQKGTKTKSSILFQYHQPFKVWYNGSMSFYQNNRKVNGLLYELSGLKGELYSNFHPASTCRFWNHSVNFETSFRNTKNTTRLRSTSLLFQCQEDWKNSVTYTISKDTRDNHVSANSGSLMKISTEVELVNFWTKTQFELNKAHSFLSKVGRNITLTSTFKAGFMNTFTQNPVPFIDHFQNGGGNDIRGFDFMGLGDKDHADALGGKYYCAYGVSLMIPFKPESNFKYHLFFNGGKLTNTHGNITKLHEHSVAIGFGVMYAVPSARFELNFTLPVQVSESDSIRKGFQYGLGMSFL